MDPSLFDDCDFWMAGVCSASIEKTNTGSLGLWLTAIFKRYLDIFIFLSSQPASWIDGHLASPDFNHLDPVFILASVTIQFLDAYPLFSLDMFCLGLEFCYLDIKSTMRMNHAF
jgi:hypothetical protein